MKADAPSFIPRLLRPVAAKHYVGGEELLARLCRDFGLRPSIQRRKLTAYLREDLDKAVNEAHLAGWQEISQGTEGHTMK